MAKIPTVRIKCKNGGKLYLQVTVPRSNERRLFKNLNTEINPANWDSKKETVKSKELHYHQINISITEAKNELIRDLEDDLRHKIAFTEAHIKRRLFGLSGQSNEDFYAFCTEQIKIKNYKPESQRSYNAEVTKMKLHSEALAFADIDYKWLQSYEHYMRSALSNHPNTVWKSLKFINTMLNTAVKSDIIKSNPMKGYNRGKYKQGIPTYLEWPEIQLFHDALKTKSMTDYLRLVGYYGLLCCYAGLRFGDAVNFDYSKKVIEDINGRRLVLYAAKNGEIVSIAFTTYISEIVDYIRDKPIRITNQEFNKALKSLRAIAGINKDFSSHSFRHSFAMHCAALGMGIDEVQRLLGHNKRSSTEMYFRVKNKRLDEAMKRWE